MATDDPRASEAWGGGCIVRLCDNPQEPDWLFCTAHVDAFRLREKPRTETPQHCQGCGAFVGLTNWEGVPTVTTRCQQCPRTPWERGQIYGLVRAAAEARIQGQEALAMQFERMAKLDVDPRPMGVPEGEWDLEQRRPTATTGVVALNLKIADYHDRALDRLGNKDIPQVERFQAEGEYAALTFVRRWLREAQLTPDTAPEQRRESATARAHDERTCVNCTGILLKGWSCKRCGVFNGEEKEPRSTCRSCDAAKA